MKAKYLLPFLILFLSTTFSYSQNYPFPTSNSIWTNLGRSNSEKYVREFADCFKINVSSPNTIETGNSKIVIVESELDNIKSLTLLSSKIDSRVKTKLERYNIKLEKTKMQQ